MTESVTPRGIVIVGAGQAGGRAAEALRMAGYDGPLVLLGEESWPPYERPPLSKDLLAGKIGPESTWIRPSRDWYAEQGIDLRLGCRVEAIDRSGRRVLLAGGGDLPYDRLLLATGARPRPLPCAGGHAAGVHYIRGIEDSLGLRASLRPGSRLLVVGAGFIGLEVAAVARAMGCAVTVIEAASHPLGRVAPREIGAFFADLHVRNGVDLRLGTVLREITQEDGRPVAHIGDGEAIRPDAILVAVGAQPNMELARDAGLRVDDGILTDEYGRTDDPFIFAAGDATRHYNPLLGRHLRLETWQNAQNQAIAVAKVMAGGTEPHAEVPWFWTDQYDVNFQSAGAPLDWQELVWRGDPAEGRFTVFYLLEGRVVGAATANKARDMRFCRQLVAEARPVDAGALADAGVPLKNLCR